MEDSDSEIDIDARNRDVHSPSQLPTVRTKKRPPKQMLSTKSPTISTKSVLKSKYQQASSSAGPGKNPSLERPVDFLTLKGCKQKGPVSSKSSGTQSAAALLQSLI